MVIFHLFFSLEVNDYLFLKMFLVFYAIIIDSPLPSLQELFNIIFCIFIVVQLLSHFQLFVTPWTAAHQAPLSSTISWSLLKFMSIESVMLSKHLILFYPILLCLQFFPASRSFPMSWLLASGGQGIFCIGKVFSA